MTARLRDLRLRLAQAIAPAGADVHDPDETACPNDRPILEAALRYDLRTYPDGRVLLDVTDEVEDAERADLIGTTPDPWGDKGESYVLTDAGAVELGRLWGDERVPPRGAGPHHCPTHGWYRLEDGDWWGCEQCRTDRAIAQLAGLSEPWWRRRRAGA